MEKQPTHLHARRRVNVDDPFDLEGANAEGGGTTPARGALSPSQVRAEKMRSKFAPPPKDHPKLRAVGRLVRISDFLRTNLNRRAAHEVAAWCEVLVREVPGIVEELTGERPAPLVQHQIGLEPGAELEHLAECLYEGHTRVAELEAENARLRPFAVAAAEDMAHFGEHALETGACHAHGITNRDAQVMCAHLTGCEACAAGCDYCDGGPPSLTEGPCAVCGSPEEVPA